MDQYKNDYVFTKLSALLVVSCLRFKLPEFHQANKDKFFPPLNSALEPIWVCFELLQMTRYKQAEFEEDDSSSVGSVQLTEGVSATTTHIRYHTVSIAEFLNSVKFGHSLWRFP
jgi:hypothetical protein